MTRIGASALGSILVLLLAASVAAAPVKITFWHIWDPGSSQGRLIEETVAEFNRLHAGEIEVEALLVGFGTFNEKLSLAIASGVPPDVAMVNIAQTQVRAAESSLVDMTPYIERDGLDLSEYWPTGIEVGRFRGGQYSLPFSTDTRVLYWNKEHFAEAGLDPEAPPETWDDLDQLRSKLTVWGSDRLERVAFHPAWGNVGALHPWVWTNGGRWFDDEGRPTFNSKEVVEAFEWAAGWIESYGVGYLDEFRQPFGGNERMPSGAAFVRDQLSMIVQTGVWAGNQLERENPDLNYGVAEIPYRREKASWSAGFDLEIIETPYRNYDAAWELVKFLTSHEFMLKWSKTRALGARPRAAVEAYPDDPNWIAQVNQMITSRFAPVSLEVPNWQSHFGDPSFIRFLRLEVTPNSFLTTIQDVVMGEFNQAVANR